MLFLASLSPLGAEPASLLRLATWNVRNYLLQNRWHDGQFRFEYPKPEREKAPIRDVLLRIRPDILFLQEIGSPEMLEELREDLAASGLFYSSACFSALPEARSGFGVLSMISPREIILLEPGDGQQSHRSFTQRGIQQVVFDYHGRRLHTFHVHLKSRYTSDKDDPESQRFRTAELESLEALLERQLSIQSHNQTLLLLGDFNTPFDSHMLDPIRENFVPIEVLDESGNPWTYHYYKTQALEQLDGFWTTPGQLREFMPTGLFPPGIDSLDGSDHRIVVVEWRADKGD